jgi:hypothetical protein
MRFSAENLKSYVLEMDISRVVPGWVCPDSRLQTADVGYSIEHGFPVLAFLYGRIRIP